MSVFFSSRANNCQKHNKKGRKTGSHKAGKKETGDPTATQKFLLFRKRFTDITRFPFTFQQDIILENICK